MQSHDSPCKGSECEVHGEMNPLNPLRTNYHTNTNHKKCVLPCLVNYIASDTYLPFLQGKSRVQAI